VSAPDLRSLIPEWIRNLVPYPPGMPIEELERELGIRDSIKLASNENPLGPSPRALAAVQAALADLHRYPDGSAFYLKRRLAERLGLPASELVVGNGSNEIIELVVRTFMRPGDEAVMADQAFVIYRMVVQAVGGTPRIVPLRDYTHDLERMADAIGPRTRLVFLANPNNPTGTIVRRPAWQAFLAAVPRHALVVADDAYAEYVADPAYPDTIRERGDGRVLVLSLRTFSKLYGLAGLRIGYGVAPPAVIEALGRVRQPFNVNALALTGALAALDDEDHVRRTLALNRDGMAFLTDAFRELRLDWVPSHANFVLVRVGPAARIYQALLRRGVIVRPMDVYGFPQHLRVTVGLHDENARFVDALRAVLAEVNGGAARSAG
jgi:histidinol-phosphate aminotransferase